MEKYLLRKGYEQLDRFMSGKDLHCHYKSKERVGDEVYIELGYGKSDNEIKELARRGKLELADEKGKINGRESFSYITQIDVQLYPDGWSSGIYIDAEGTFEYKNLIKKIDSEENMEKFKALIDEVVEEGYALYVDTDEELVYSEPSDFINKIVEEYNAGKEFYIRIVKVVADDVRNEIKEKVINSVIDEFNKLYHLYDFMSWNTINNNYIF